MYIDVKKELGVDDTEVLFIKQKPVDKLEAAKRLAITEKMFEEWHADINRTNTRELPDSLKSAYEDACVALCKILMMEKEIITDNNA